MKPGSIEDAFYREGYTSIPFTFNGAGHPLIKATLSNNYQANFLLDTGASINLLDYGFAKEMSLTLTATGEKGGGAGGLLYDVFSLGGLSFAVNGCQFRFDSFYSMDFTTIKEALSAKEVTEEIQGILGVEFFKMTRCFIDYCGNRIFVVMDE